MLLEQLGNGLGFFDGDGPHQHRLPTLVILPDAVGQGIVFLQNAVDHGREFFALGTIDHVGMLFADQRTVGRDHHDVQVVNFGKLRSFRLRRPGHAGQFLVHAEIILKRDGGQRLILALDLHAFLGFHRLVQTVRPAPPGHLSPGKFIHDDHFTVFNDVVHVFAIQRVRAHRLIHVVHDVDVRRVRHVGQPEQTLALRKSFFRQRGGAVLLIQRVVNVLDELGNNLVDFGVLVGGLFGRPGNNERGARFVNQN